MFVTRIFIGYDVKICGIKIIGYAMKAATT